MRRGTSDRPSAGSRRTNPRFTSLLRQSACPAPCSRETEGAHQSAPQLREVERERQLTPAEKAADDATDMPAPQPACEVVPDPDPVESACPTERSAAGSAVTAAVVEHLTAELADHSSVRMAYDGMRTVDDRPPRFDQALEHVQVAPSGAEGTDVERRIERAQVLQYLLAEGHVAPDAVDVGPEADPPEALREDRRLVALAHAAVALEELLRLRLELRRSDEAC